MTGESLEQIIAFGKELGFETNELGVFLPIEKFESYEWGVYTTNEVPPKVYLKDSDGKIKFGESIQCFTPQIVLRTLKVDDKEFLIERKDEDKLRLDNKGLILAFMYKDQGSIDSSFLNLAWNNLLKIVPEKIVKKYAGKKVDELTEKLIEVNNLNDLIDEKDLQKITGVLVDELFIYGKLNPKLFNNIENKNIQQIYKTLIKKGQIYDAKRLLGWSEIKPKFEETFVQEGYKTLIKKGWIDDAERLLDWSGIIPEDENIKKILLVTSASPKKH